MSPARPDTDPLIKLRSVILASLTFVGLLQRLLHLLVRVCLLLLLIGCPLSFSPSVHLVDGGVPCHRMTDLLGIQAPRLNDCLIKWVRVISQPRPWVILTATDYWDLVLLDDLDSSLARWYETALSSGKALDLRGPDMVRIWVLWQCIIVYLSLLHSLDPAAPMLMLLLLRSYCLENFWPAIKEALRDGNLVRI